MISHYFTLRALCAELDLLCRGATVRDAYTRVRDEMGMTLDPAGGGEPLTLVICVGAGVDVVFLRQGKSRPKRNTADIFPETFGRTISGITAGEFSRVVTISAGDLEVRIHLFGNAVSNVFLVDPGGMVVSSLKNGREFAGKPYGTGKIGREVVRPGDRDRLTEILAESGGDAGKALKTAFPWLGALYARELLARCSPAAADAGGDAAPGSDGGAVAGGGEFARTVTGVLGKMLDEASRAFPAHYDVEGFPSPLLSVVPLTTASPAAPVTFATVNEAVRETFFARRNRSGFERERDLLLAAAAKDREKVERSLRQATARAGDDSAPAQHRRTGGLILANLNDIRKGQTEVELPGGEGEPPLRVRLDRSLTPAGNANLYFERARKAEKDLEESARRVGELREKLGALDGWIAALDACEGPDDLREVLEARRKKNPAPGVVLETAGGERLPFRVFPLGEQYEAWVGKSSADNDLLTTKYAGPHDYWFHVRGASGSHVVLKNRSGARVTPPGEAIRAAARLAAYFSKMRKAGNVPVAYCERKYVKKPKNAPAGTVTLAREEIIFVTPGLP